MNFFSAVRNIFLLGFFLIGVGSLHAQKATAEFITSLSPPQLSDTIPIIDGERYVTYHQNYLFIVNFWSGIQIFNISDLRAPVKIGFIRTRDMVHHVNYQDNRLFISSETEGVLIYDISNIMAPVRVAQIKTPGNAHWSAYQAPYLYVALGNDGFCILDISNLDNPRTVALEILDNWVWSLTLANNRLVVAAKQGGLGVYDISDPENPSRLTQYRTGYQALQLQIEDQLAYVADGPGGLLILDISAPALPKVVGRFPSKGFSQQVFKSGNYAYLANRELGLLIVNVTDPSNPYLEGQYTPESESYSVFKKDVYVYLTTDKKTEVLRHNNQPVLEPLADAVIDENTVYSLQLKAHDPDGDPLIFEAFNLPEGSVFDPAAALFTWKPTYEQSGEYPGLIFRVSETTESALFDADTIRLSVTHVNRLPDLPVLSNATLPEDSLLEIQVPEATDPDVEDAGRISYRAENLPEGAAFDSTTRLFRWKPTFEQSGTYVVDFLANDGSGGVDREAVTLTILHVDRPPVIQPVADQTVDENQPLTVQIAGEEPDSEDLNRIQFSMLNLPEGAMFNPATAQLTWTPGYDQSGDYPGVTAVMTAGALADTTRFSIHVNHVNRPPVLDPLTAQTVDENRLLSFRITGADPDAEDAGQLVWSAANLPEGAIFNPDSQIFSWTPTFEQSGEYPDIRFTLTDPQGLESQQSVTISVNHVNRPPVLEEVAGVVTDENQPVTVQLSASDPDKEDQQKIVFSCANLPAGAQLDPASGLLSWTPGFDQSGSYQINLTVSDGVLSDSKLLAVTVNHVNRPPEIGELADQVVDENTRLSFTVTGNDPDAEDAGQLVWSAANLPEGSTFDPATQQFSWTPTFEQAGLYTTVVFSLQDPAGLSAEKSISITVNNTNRPPVITSVEAQTTDEMQAVSFTLAASDPDLEDAGKLVFSLNEPPQGSTLNPKTGVFRWTPTYEQSGEFRLTARVTDSGGLFAETPVMVTVNNVNRSPKIGNLEEVTGKEDSPLRIDPGISDPDKEDEGRLSVTAGNLPAGASLDGKTGVITWKPRFDQAGEYSINLQVTDASGATASGKLAVKIENLNRAPELKGAGNKKLKEGETVSFALSAEDPDAEDAGKLKFSVDNLPRGASFDAGSGSFSWTPGSDQQGDYQVTFRVSDSGGLSDSKTVKITVEDVPPPAPEN